jgi:hypothetical protein
MVKKLLANKDERKEKIKRQIKENSIEINKGMFFLPDDLRKLKGKWVLYVRKGMLTRIAKKKEKKVKSFLNSPQASSE